MTYLLAPFTEPFDGPRGYRYAPPFDDFIEGENLATTKEQALHLSRLELDGDGSVWTSSGPYPLTPKLPENYEPGDDPFPFGADPGTISMPLKVESNPPLGDAVPYGSQLSFGILPWTAYQYPFNLWLSDSSPGPYGWGEVFIKNWNPLDEYFDTNLRAGTTGTSFYDTSLTARLVWQSNGRIRLHTYGSNRFFAGRISRSYTVQEAGNPLPSKLSFWFDSLQRLNIATDDVWQFSFSLVQSSTTPSQFFTQEPMINPTLLGDWTQAIDPGKVYRTYSVGIRVMFPVLPDELSGGAWNAGSPILGQSYRGQRYKVLEAITSWWDFAGTLPDSGFIPALHQNRSDFLGAGGAYRSKSYTQQTTIWQNAPY